MNVKGTRASMPHAGDSILIQGMRQINVAEIGSDTREHRELSELTFEAELEEQAETKAEKLKAEETAVQQQKLVQGMDTDGQFSQGVKSKMPSSLAVIPKSSGADSEEIIASDPCDLPVLKECKENFLFKSRKRAIAIPGRVWYFPLRTTSQNQ